MHDSRSRQSTLRCGARLDHSYGPQEIMAALPRPEAVGIAALPLEIQRKARAHGDPLDNIVASE